MDTAQDVSDPAYARSLFEALVRGTQLSNALATSEQHEYASTFPQYSAAMGGLSQRLNGMINGLVDQHSLPPPPAGRPPPLGLPAAAMDEVSGRFDSVVDLSERLLESVDADLDRARGLSHSADMPPPATPARAMGGAPVTPQARSSAGMPGSALSAGSATRPQLRWREDIHNSRPFVPRIRDKPNALVPLELRLEVAEDAAHPYAPRQPPSWYANPYGPELRAFAPNDLQLASLPERLYAPVHSTPCTWVASEPQLAALRDTLNASREFALDLENHSYRSYRGFVCLMQISTREEDFLVDTLELRKSLHILNEPFTNPAITKVMHGADSDILWLQRDFDLYVVGLFDTGQAARVLEYPSFSLAHLLRTFCGVNANKTYQHADWRIRPLTEDMINYAREDSHYLLYIYDKLKAELAPRRLILPVWQRSAELCKQAYKVPPFNPDDHQALLRRQDAVLNPTQVAVHRSLYCWRDAVAREEDESAGYVLPNHALLKLALAMPRTAEQLTMSLQHPLPPLLQFKAQSLLGAISAAIHEASAPPPPAAGGAATSPHASRAALLGIGGGAPPQPFDCRLRSSSGGASVPLHPMQPALLPHLPSAPMPPLPPGPPPAAFAAAAAPPADGGGATRVRNPPTPSRSPPLPAEQMFPAAGWVGTLGDEGGGGLLDARGRREVAPLAAAGGSGLFDGVSDGSSDEEGEEQQAAAVSIQQRVLSMFAPLGGGGGGGGGGGEASAAPSAAAKTAADEPSVTRSLNEIYKLSNLNKRRGGAARKSGEEEAAAAAAEAADSSDSEMASGDEVAEEAEDDMEEEEEERRKGGGEGEAWGGASKEDTEEFMKRIGWLDKGEAAVEERPPVFRKTSAAEPAADAADGEVGGLLSPADAAFLPPFQRQQPPNLPKPHAAPPPQVGMPMMAPHHSLPQQQHQGGGKSSKPRLKKRPGGSGDAHEIDFHFMGGAAPQGRPAPFRQGGGFGGSCDSAGKGYMGGKGGSEVGKGGGGGNSRTRGEGNRGQQPAGNRSMTFPAGRGRSGGGGGY